MIDMDHWKFAKRSPFYRLPSAPRLPTIEYWFVEVKKQLPEKIWQQFGEDHVGVLKSR